MKNKVIRECSCGSTITYDSIIWENVWIADYGIQYDCKFCKSSFNILRKDWAERSGVS